MKCIIKVASVGPGDPDLMNSVTQSLLTGSAPLILRTSVHPLAHWLTKNGIPFHSTDDLYDTAEDFDELSASISAFIWQEARQHGEVVYAVSDSSSDETVKALYTNMPEHGKIVSVPGFSYADLYLPSCLCYMDTSNVHICTARNLLSSEIIPDISLLVTEVNDELTAGEIKNRLLSWFSDDDSILLLNEKGIVKTVPLYELDRQPFYNHLTAVAVKGKPCAERSKKNFSDLLSIMDFLRSPEGCSWDRAQTHITLRRYLIEEAWEAVDAINEQDDVHLQEELGDLLFQIVFHASIGKSFDEFTIQDILTGICNKMIRRHPAVFGKRDPASDGSSENEWESIKRKERGSTSFSASLKGISSGLPSLLYAEKLIGLFKSISVVPRSAAEIIFSIKAVLESIASANPEKAEDLMGSLLFYCTELCCCTGVDGENALHHRVTKIIDCIDRMQGDRNTPDGSNRLTFNDLGVY